jgi:hypothetical protein
MKQFAMHSRRSFVQCAGMAGVGLCCRTPLFAEGDSSKLLNEFGYGDVELAAGPAQTQFEQTQAVLMSLNEDSLLKPWRLRAGLPAPTAAVLALRLPTASVNGFPRFLVDMR